MWVRTVVEWRCPICGNEIDHLGVSGRVGLRCSRCQRTVCVFCVAVFDAVREQQVVCKQCAKAFKDPVKKRKGLSTMQNDTFARVRVQ
jgi:hypothetical protein